MIKVSIIIPVWNQVHLIEKCLDSIPKRKDIEIIVIDDCSTDGTSDILVKYPNIKYIKNSSNMGVGHNRNIGLDMAQGEYICFIDSDDYIYPDAFNKVVDNYLNSGWAVVKTLHERNDMCTWVPWVHRGDFIKKSTIGKLRHPEIRCNEDSKFAKAFALVNPNATTIKSNILMYHYNEPREGSLTWLYRHRKDN